MTLTYPHTCCLTTPFKGNDEQFAEVRRIVSLRYGGEGAYRQGQLHLRLNDERRITYTADNKDAYWTLEQLRLYTEGVIAGVLGHLTRPMKIRLYNITLDTDGKEQELPREIVLEVPPDLDVNKQGADLLSDRFGWCVNSFNWSYYQ